VVVSNKTLFFYLIQNSPAVKGVQAVVKKDVKYKVAAEKSLWWYANGKNLISTIQVNLVSEMWGM